MAATGVNRRHAVTTPAVSRRRVLVVLLFAAGALAATMPVAADIDLDAAAGQERVDAAIATGAGVDTAGPVPANVADADAETTAATAAWTAPPLLQALDDAVWIGDGPASDRHVYVLFATDCRWSRALFEQTRDRAGDLQLRWLVMAGAGAEQVAGQATLDVLADAFAGRIVAKVPATAQHALDSNAWLQPLLGAGHRFPVLVYQAHDGVRIESGLRQGLPAAEEVVARPDSGGHRPAIRRLLVAPRPTWQPAPAGPYIRFHAEPAPVHALPSRDSLQVGQLPHLGTYPAVLGLIGNDWIEVAGLRVADRGGRTLSAYIHAPEAVALMRLEYTVEPASGEIVADALPRPIHSHPDHQAPVLDWLQTGYRMDRVGQVQQAGQAWDVVVFFTDGSHAFVPH